MAPAHAAATPAVTFSSASPEFLHGADGQPIDYPLPVVVKNTFIDFHQLRPPSLDEFVQERLVKSCPTSLTEEVPDEAGDAPMGAARTDFGARPWARGPSAWIRSLMRSKTVGAAPDEDGAGLAAAASAAAEAESPVAFGEMSAEELPRDAHSVFFNATSDSSDCSTTDSESAHGRRPAPGAAKAPTILLLEDAVAGLPPQGFQRCEGFSAQQQQQQQQPVAGGGDGMPPFATLPEGLAARLGTPELPSVGSITHDQGQCKPCAFFNSKGCKSGSQCPFCHKCEPGEKKRRQKEKRAFFGSMRKLQEMASSTFAQGSARQA